MVGDVAPIEIAAVLTGTCRASDVLARLGGDEFMPLLANSGVDDMHRVRDRLHEMLERRNQQLGIDRRIRASIGIAV